MKIVIVGQGGHSKVLKDIILANKEHELIGYLDDKYEGLTHNKDIYIGSISSAHMMIERVKDLKFIIGIGDNELRENISRKLNLPIEFYATLIHKSAIVSPSALIGHGSVIMAKTVINANTQIGCHSIVNTGAVIEHDNVLSEFVHVSPNATLTGSVKIGKGVHIGAGATIIPNIRIEEWSIIGAGATVINDIPANSTAVGVPAKLKNKK
jgi:acetyltransferase EpsM